MARQTARRQTGRKPSGKAKSARKPAAKKAAAKPAKKKTAASKPTAKAALKEKPEPKPKPKPQSRREVPPEVEVETFTSPILGATFGSLVIVTVVAILNTSLGRGLEDNLDAPARALIAAPVIMLAGAVVIACLLALVPEYRRGSLRIAEIAGWLIPSWLVMCGMAVGAVAWALAHG